jgi:hypothetical protein
MIIGKIQKSISIVTKSETSTTKAGITVERVRFITSTKYFGIILVNM